MFSYCEIAVGISNGIGYEDEGCFDALVNILEQTLKVICQLFATGHKAMYG